MTRDVLSSIVWNLKPLQSSELLFKTDTHKELITPMDFHDACDDKGATLTIVKTSDNQILGAYNPVSFISENVYR